MVQDRKPTWPGGFNAAVQQADDDAAWEAYQQEQDERAWQEYQAQQESSFALERAKERQEQGTWEAVRPKVGFVEGFGSDWMGIAGTAARAARLPEEAIVQTLKSFGLDESDERVVRGALGTLGAFKFSRLIAGQGEKAQAESQAIVEGQTPTFRGKLGGAFATALALSPAAIAGGALGAAGLAGEAATAAAGVGGAVGSGTAGAVVTSESLLERAEALGVSPERKLGAMAAGVPIGAIEGFGLGRHLGKLGKVFAGGSKEVKKRLATDLLQTAAMAGLEEGLEEIPQGLGEEAVEQWILEDPEKHGRSLLEWAKTTGEIAMNEGLPAAIVGMVLGGMARAGTLARERERGDVKPGEVSPDAPLTDFGKVAREQGALPEREADDAGPEWEPLREALSTQNETPVRFVKPGESKAVARAQWLAKKLGLDIRFVDVAPQTNEAASVAEEAQPSAPEAEGAPAASVPVQEPGQTEPLEAASAVEQQGVAADTQADSSQFVPQTGPAQMPMPTGQSPAQRPNPKPKRSGFNIDTAPRAPTQAEIDAEFERWATQESGAPFVEDADLETEAERVQREMDRRDFGARFAVRRDGSRVATSREVGALQAFFERASKQQSRYQGNKGAFFAKNAPKLGRWLIERASDAETVFDMYVGGGTYGLTMVSAKDALPNVKRVVLNEIDPAKRNRLEQAALNGSTFMSHWTSDPMFVQLQRDIVPLIGKSSTPARTLLETVSGKSTSATYTEAARKYGEWYRGLDAERLAAFQFVYEVMFSGRTASWGHLIGNAIEDAERFHNLYKQAADRGITVEFASMDATSPEAVAAVQGAGRSLVVLDPPYHATSAATYQAGDATDADLGSVAFLRKNLDAAQQMARGNAVIYNNNDSAEVQQEARSRFGNTVESVHWKRGAHPEYLGLIDGRSESVSVGSEGGGATQQSAAEPAAAGGQRGVLEEPRVDAGGQADPRAPQDARSAGRGSAGERQRVAPQPKRATGPLRFPAAYMSGRVAIDVNAASPVRLLFHEGLHHLAVANPKGFVRLLRAMTTLKPAQIAAAKRAYAKAFGEGAPTGAALDEEAAAVLSEDLAGLLEQAFNDPDKLARVLSDRSVFEVVRDWIARLAKVFGGEMQTSIEKRLAAIGAPDVDAVKLALLWKETADMASRVAEQEGAKFAAAYHGTPFDFDKFDMSKVGTGEGAQAYGYGLYFASNREVAEHYRKALAGVHRTLLEKARHSYEQADSPLDAAEALLSRDDLTTNERELLSILRENDWLGFDYPHEAVVEVMRHGAVARYDLDERARDAIERIRKDRLGKVYEVELAPQEDEYLLWSEPFSAQSPKVQAALRSMPAASSVTKQYADSPNMLNEMRGGLIYQKTVEMIFDSTPKKRIGRVDMSAEASRQLRAAGIRGIKYLDGGSRSAGDGSYNYVLFDDKDVSIKAKFALAPPTDSPEFKRWFGDSKVVDANGKPLVVWHGTRSSGFDAFDPSKRGSQTDDGWLGRGFYFTSDPNVAAFMGGLGSKAPQLALEMTEEGREAWTKRSIGNGAMGAFYLSVQNPLELRPSNFDFDKRILVREALDLGVSATADDVASALDAAGHDGVVLDYSGTGYKHVEVLAVRPEQIKSATGNRGTFDPTNPDIRFAVSPEDRARMQAAAERAAAEGEETEIGSKPSRIADTTDDAGRRALRRGVREVRAESEEVVTLREQYAKADELLKDAEAAGRLYDRIQKGEILQAHEQVAFDKIRANKSLDYLSDPSPEKLTDAVLNELAYEDMRRDTARALGAIRDALGRVRSGREILADFVFDLSPDIKLRIERLKKQRAKAVEKTRIAEIEKSIARLLRIEARRVEKARKALAAAGFDPALITSDYFKEPATMARIARIIATSKSPKWDWYKEFIISSMLSGTGTQVVNTTGNIVNSVLEHHLNRISAAMVNTFVRSPDAPTWAENAAFYKAWGAGVANAADVLVKSLKSDMPVFEIELRKKGIEKAEGAKLDIGRAAIPGLAGRIIRGPSLTTIRAVDEAARAIAYTTEGTALAFRAAKREGVKGDELARRTLEILHGPFREDVHGASLSKANELTFHDPDGKMAKGVLELRRWFDTQIGTEKSGFIPIGTHLAPFISFAAKAFKMGIGLPMHPAFTLVRMMQRGVGKGPYVGSKVNFVNDAARSIVGLSVLFAVLKMISDRDEETGLPRITGPSRPGEWSQDYRTAPPMSIRFNGKWYDYGRLDPLSTSVGLLVNAARTADEKDDWGAGVAEILRSIPALAADKTFLQTFGNIYRAVTEPDDSRWGDKLGKIARDSFLGPMVPNIIKSTARSTDPYVHVSASRPDGDDGAWDAFTKDIGYMMFPAAQNAPPIKHDLWGRPVKRAGESFLGRMLAPMKTTGVVEDVSQLDLLILKFNDRFERGEIGNAEARRFVPRPPDYSYTNRNGERVYFTDAQYERLTREAGQMAAERLIRSNLNYESPDWEDIERIKRAISQARSRVKSAIIRESPIDESVSSR